MIDPVILTRRRARHRLKVLAWVEIEVLPGVSNEEAIEACERSLMYLGANSKYVPDDTGIQGWTELPQQLTLEGT